MHTVTLIANLNNPHTQRVLVSPEGKFYRFQVWQQLDEHLGPVLKNKEWGIRKSRFDPNYMSAIGYQLEEGPDPNEMVWIRKAPEPDMPDAGNEPNEYEFPVLDINYL